MKRIKMWILASGLFMATGCGPKDSDIQSGFNEKKNADGRLANVSATVNKGVITLNGQCPDVSCKTYAEQSAKEVKGVKSVVNNITVMPLVTSAPAVEISSDAALQTGLRDATKDYPGVNATTTNGEVTLTGTIERDRLPRLLQAVNALNPRKVNNNLTIK